MESYKAENQHWLSQLNETQREHMELRTRLTEQKALHVKQLAEKDAHIEHLRSVINNLKVRTIITNVYKAHCWIVVIMETVNIRVVI